MLLKLESNEWYATIFSGLVFYNWEVAVIPQILESEYSYIADSTTLQRARYVHI